jgi:tetratricopeptide (TPR) repeat protein
MSRRKNLGSLVLAALVAVLLAAPLAADWESGIAAFKAGDLAGAEAEFRALTEERPDWAGGHLMLGQTLLRDRRVDEALPFLERAHELAPQDLNTALVLGQTYVQLERFGDAARVMQGHDPASLPAAQKTAFYRTRAIAAVHSGQEVKAIEDLEAAIELAPEDADLHRQLAQAARGAGLTAVAVEHYNHALELDPNDVAATRALAQLLYDRAVSAGAGAQAGLCRDVVPHARRLVKLDESYENLVLLGEAARCAGLNEIAESALELALAQRSDEWWPHFALGRAQARLGKWTAAEAALKTAIAKNVPEKDKAAVVKQLGHVYERQGRLDKALAHYSLAGDAEGVQRVEQNLIAREEEEVLARLAEEKRRIEEELRRLEGEGGL